MGLVNSVYGYVKGSNPNPEKEIKETFMPKIQREPKEKNFNKKLSSNLTKYLFDFFSYKELYELGKINVFFMNNLVNYIESSERWPEKVRKLNSQYKFKIYQGEVDNSLKEAKIKKRKYKFDSENDKQVNYYQFDMDGNKYISIARTFNWAHKDNEMYWRDESIKNSLEENQKVPFLIIVCWIDTNFSFLHVKPGNYKLYINEHFVTHKNFIEKVKLRVIINEGKENKVLFDEKFPSREIFNKNNSSNSSNAILNEDFICYIKKEDFDGIEKDENGDCIVKIQFNQTDNFWKGGWYIDGGILKEVTQKEIDEEIEKIIKMQEEEERKKIFGNVEEENVEFDDGNNHDDNNINNDNENYKN